MDDIHNTSTPIHNDHHIPLNMNENRYTNQFSRIDIPTHRYSYILSLYISHTYFRKMLQCYLYPIKNAINHQNLTLPVSFVVTSNEKLHVTVHDVLCLANYTYLNDIVINYILQAHHNEADRLDIYLLDSLFFTSRTHPPNLASNWTKN